MNICTDRYSKTNAFSLFSEATVDLKVSGLNTIHSGHADYAGIRVAADAKLTISADDFGYLYAKSGQDSTPVYAAGIGGNNNESCGEVIINGGYITAVGKAAIGGGNYASGGTIVINGGEVNAEGIVVGIGNGWGYTGSEGAVTIKGGYVAAKSRSYGEGISSGKIRITGGTVKAVGTGCRGINSPAANIVVTGGTIFDSECRPYSNGLTDVYPTILALPYNLNVSEILVTQGSNSFSYGAKDVRSDSVINNNKLTIFLPAYADNETTISVKVGGLTYNYHGMVSGQWPYYLKADQEPLLIRGINDTHEFGELISLSAEAKGGSGNGAVTWLYEGTGTTSYSSAEAPIYPGTYKVTVTKAADDSYYETSASKEFKITGEASPWFLIEDIPSQLCTGSAIEPPVTVKFDRILTRDVDYTVSFANNTAVGTATVTVTGKGVYIGSKTKNFQISEKVRYFTLSYVTQTEVEARLVATADINELPPGTLTFKSGNTVIASGVAFKYENSIYTAATTWSGIPPGTNTVTAEYVPGTNDGYSLYPQATLSFCLCKTVPSGFAFASGTINKTCGDSPFTVIASGGPGTGAVTYKSSDTSIATIGENTGLVTILKPGTITLTATQAEDDQYASVSPTATLIIAEPDITAPTLSAASCSEVTPSGATVNFTSDEAGTYYYLVQLANAAEPTAAEVKDSGISGTASADSNNRITLSNLSGSTAYIVYIVETDKYLNLSTLSSVSFTPDNTAPTLSAVSCSDVSASGAAVTFTSDEAGTYYYLAVSATFVPTALQVQNYGTSGNAIAGSGNNITVTGLSGSTEYTVYVVQTDAAGNLSDLSSVTFSTSAEADRTAPRLSWISYSEVSSTGATVTFTSDEAGTYYYLVYASTADAPTAAEVKNSGISGAAGAVSDNRFTITGLTASTDYTVYIVESDAAGNLSSLDSVSFSTNGPPSSNTDKVLKSIMTPTAVTGVANGTAKTSIDLGLPATVTLVTDQGNASASVAWAVYACSYAPSIVTEQTFSVDGTVTLPDRVINPDNVSLDTSISVTVNAAGTAAVTGVTLNKAATAIVKGASETLAAAVTPSSASNQAVTWSSDKDTVATVDQTGKVTGITAGTAIITVTTNDGAKTATCQVTVTEPITATQGGTVSVTTTPVTITVPSNTTESKIVVTPNTALPLVEVNTASASLGTVEMDIPAGTIASGSANWSGEITLPTVKAISSTAVSGAQTVNAVVVVGCGDEIISFSKAVRLLIPGMAGKSAGYIRNGVFTVITRTISADNQTTANAEIPANGDGKIDVENDLVIWTKHFTEFIAYTPSQSSSSGDSESSTSPYVNSSTGSASVTPNAGGKVGLDSYASVEIPAGALKGSTALTVKIEKVTTPPAIPSGFKSGSDIYDFTVDGKSSYSFNKPVIICLQFNADDFQAQETPAIYYYDEQSAQWVKAGGTVSGSAISVAVDHFTKYAILAEKQTKTQTVPKQTGLRFNDLQNHWAKDAINKLADLGAISGYPDGSFKPEAKITRAEFITMLVKTLKLTAGKESKLFNDMRSHWAKDSIDTVVVLGIAGGYADGSFKPDEPITREEMAVMAAKAAKMPEVAGETTFADNGKLSYWAKGSVVSAVNANVMSGYPDRTFRPQGKTTRAEAVSVILNLIK